jgi:hypothetical protein
MGALMRAPRSSGAQLQFVDACFECAPASVLEWQDFNCKQGATLERTHAEEAVPGGLGEVDAVHPGT